MRRGGHQAFGEGLYAPAMGQRTYTETLRVAEDMVRAGWPVVVDGSFSTVAERRAARELADRRSVPHATVWCDAPDAVLAHRLRRRSADGREISDAREELLEHHRARYESPVGEPN